MLHTLSPADQKRCREVSVARHDQNVAAGVKDMQRGRQDTAEIELNGMGGEVAFCRLFGLEPDWVNVPGGKGRDDAKLPDGRIVDVKTTDHPRGNLIARKIHDDVDVFVLMRGRFPCYKAVGWIEKGIFQRSRKKNLGHGPTHFYKTENLHPMDTLLG